MKTFHFLQLISHRPIINGQTRQGRRLAGRLAAALMASTCAAALSGGAHADTFNNGSFETGDLTGWTTGGGYWYGGAYPVPADYLPGGANYVAGAGPVTITNVGLDPQTDNNLNEVYAGNHSVQVNNPVNDYSVAVISQRVNNYTDSQIAFAYAAVLQASHGPTDSDAFIITLTDATKNQVLYSFNLNSATAPGSFTESSSGWFYTNWVTETIDVSALKGDDFILSLLANDCPYGGHAGYAYLDGFGSQTGGGGTGGNSYLYWDGDASGNAGNKVVDGGNGVWNATSTNWTESTGTTNGAYSPQPGSVIFTGQPGVVTVDNSAGAIAVTGMQFATDGYVITGDPVTLSGASATIQVGDGTSAGAGYTATINSQLIGTAALMKTDLGTLILNGANTYSGGTAILGGTLIGSASSFGAGDILDNATLVIDQPADASFANAINGSGLFYKRGAGLLDMTGASGFTGATTVEAGRLNVDGSLAGSVVTVQNGAILGGSGTVGGVVAQTGSTVAPGGPTTMLNVVGDYSQAAGSTYQVEAASTGAANRILVGGSANLASGANLQLVKSDSAPFVLGTRYVVLSSVGDVTGVYTLSGDTHVSAFIDVVANYDVHDVFLDVSQTHSFASAGVTRNQIAAGGGADKGYGPLFTAIVYLPTFADAQAAFDQISGEIHATADSATLEDSRFVREAVFDRLRGDSGGDQWNRAIWGRTFGSWGHINSDGNAATLRRDIGGVFVGADVLQGKSWRAGLVGGFSHSSMTISARNSGASSDDYHVGVYAGLENGPLDLRFGAAYTRRDVTTNRSVSINDFRDNLTSGYGIDLAQAFGEIGYRFSVGSAIAEPFANLAAVDIMTRNIAESGGDAALTGKTPGADVIFSTIGMHGSASITTGKGNAINVYALAGWRHAEGDVTPTANLQFAGGRPFTVAGLPIAKNAVALEAGLSAAVGKRADISVGYSGQMGGGVTDNGAKATITVRF